MQPPSLADNWLTATLAINCQHQAICLGKEQKLRYQIYPAQYSCLHMVDVCVCIVFFSCQTPSGFRFGFAEDVDLLISARSPEEEFGLGSCKEVLGHLIADARPGRAWIPSSDFTATHQVYELTTDVGPAGNSLFQVRKCRSLALPQPPHDTWRSPFIVCLPLLPESLQLKIGKPSWILPSCKSSLSRYIKRPTAQRVLFCLPTGSRTSCQKLAAGGWVPICTRC